MRDIVFRYEFFENVQKILNTNFKNYGYVEEFDTHILFKKICLFSFSDVLVTCFKWLWEVSLARMVSWFLAKNF